MRQILNITQSLFGADADFTSVIRSYEQWANAEVRSVEVKGS